MTVTFGNVPHPAYEDHPITKAEGQGQNNLGRRSVKGVVWHRMIGSLRGTDRYFAMPSTNALTDYGVGVAAQDGPQDDGVIIRWNDPLGTQSGWASGTYSSAAYGDGEAFVEKYASTSSIGLNVINRDQASIEISGLTYDVPLSEKSRNAIAQLTAYWADQYKIPWDVFPIAPQDGFSFVRWHNEFGPDNGAKRCPGAVVMAETSALIERTRQVMKAYQVTADAEEPAPIPKPPVYTPPALPEWWERALEQRTPSDTMVNGMRWFAIRRRVEAIRNANRYSAPDTSAPKSGPKVLVREKINIERWFRDADGRQWIVEDAGHFLTASAFTPAISLRGR